MVQFGKIVQKKYGLIIDKFERNQDVVIKKLDDNTYSFGLS